jgi:Fe-S-cluster containining protein
LPLHHFRIDNIGQLDHAMYVLNFDRIELGLTASGDWGIYYRYPCRFLDRERHLCRLHDTLEQPRICVHYDPYACWYKKHVAYPSEEFLRIDRPRMAFIASRIEFDDDRNIVAVPDWETLCRELPKIEPESAFEPDDVVGHDPIYDQWRNEAVSLPPAPPRPRSYAQVQDPCSGCSAACCKTLVFPHGMPATASSLDYLRFCLGFPGVEVGVSDRTWSLVVKTTCRHLEDNRCSIYGRPERPMLCKYFDAMHCTYRTEFGVPRPVGFMRLRLDDFDVMTSCFTFDGDGRIIEMPSTEQIRAKIEDRWRAR